MARFRAAKVAFVVTLGVLGTAKSARADESARPTLSGAWSASAMTESWSTKDWGEACGPKPTSGGGAPSGGVTVTEQGGELAFSGAGRAFSTAQCWEQLPGMTRTSHSAAPRGWSTRCSSAAGDPRRAVVVTSITATDDMIIFSERGTYELTIQGTACNAAVARSRTFKLQSRAGDAPAPTATATATASATPPAPAATATGKPREPLGDCSEPGAPARLEVRPARKLLRPGESFTLAASVTDAKGCKLGVEPDIRAKPGSALDGKLQLQGAVVTAATDAPEGIVELAVSVAGKSVSVTVEIASPDKYAGLLKERGLNDVGEDDHAATAEIASSLGGSATVAEDGAKGRKLTFVAVVIGIASALGFVGFFLLRRGKRAGERVPVERESVVAPPPNVALFEAAPSAPMECPECGSTFPPGTAFCHDDGTPLVPLTGAGAHRDSLPAPSEDPSSGPPISAAPRSKKGPPKICPTCGDMFPDDATFCGKDGTQLVPVN